MSAKDKRVAVLVADMYQELEFWYPYLRLTEEGAKVVAVGPEKREYKSRLGYPVPAELAAAQVHPAEFEAVVIPGGYAPDYMRRSPALVSFVREMAQAGKPVAAICHGGWMLCSARVVKGKRVTSVAAIRDDLENAGATWVDEEVVRDGNLITSRVPSDLPAFLRAILASLA
ncbi:MAG TPA: type 1 glutamine amidotransferase domain-containing protein [Candidatus Bipolaricaulis sp.]|nr:type 1 glutamine amidotransferase [Candidatus Bipolaricaulis sp.]HPD06433.1 type 1 glutamine amidotransferase domain-containing protein [Candidatus Bipolaricaulis sp.]HRS14097.1 type 1 glutamine amidotransferase domain-containing protein [Candidatus Bipolaricaulis sp.]HRU21830.1 type 1 glutamine amidotransferase domain-containing protein [Candidatus Bipolaricaulis sp.]